MSIFDIVVLALFIFAFVRGAISGIFKQLGILVGVVLALLFTGLLSSLFSDLIFNITSGGTRLEGTLCYAIVFVTIVLLSYIVSILLHKTSKAMKIGWIDRIAGAFFGGAKLLLILGVVISIYEGVYRSLLKTAPPEVESIIYKPLLEYVSVVIDFIGNYGSTQ